MKRSTFPLILLVGAISAVGAAPASAAVTFDKASEIKALNGLGRCIGTARRGAAEEALSLAFGSPEQGKAAVAFLGPENNCFKSDVSFNFEPNLFVGGMAEGLFLDRYGSADVAAIAAGSNVEPRNEVEDLGLCVVRRNPKAVRALIESQPASPAESQAVSAMAPDLGPCVPKGMEVALSKSRMRALFAASLYRIASAGQ